MLAKRGLKLDCVYYHAYPYTSEDVLNKVKELTKILSPYIGGTNFFVVPFTEAQLRINERALPQEVTLLMRAGMVKIAEMLAHRNRAACLVTGESLSQVASQTLESITFTGSAAQMPIFRPLMGLDKEEIIQRAREVGTFETSILPYDDCCTIFTAEHPLLKPGMERMWKSWDRLEIEQLLTQAADKAERHYVHPIYGFDTTSSNE
jgi:thiamine biosynthesis protein ThiI